MQLASGHESPQYVEYVPNVQSVVPEPSVTTISCPPSPQESVALMVYMVVTIEESSTCPSLSSSGSSDEESWQPSVS